jgi:hypothetical protein
MRQTRILTLHETDERSHFDAQGGFHRPDIFGRRRVAGSKMARSRRLMNEDDQAAQHFMGLVGRLLAIGPPELSSVGAGLLVALRENITADSRSFARLFGIDHKLVLREVAMLKDSAEPLMRIESRDRRTQRMKLALTDAGQLLMRRAEVALL